MTARFGDDCGGERDLVDRAVFKTTRAGRRIEVLHQ